MIFRKIFDKKLLKFAIAGLINTIVGSAIMFLLYNLAHFSYWLASACNYLIAGTVSFFLYKYYVFGVRRFSLFMVFAFAITIALSYIIAYGISKPLMNYFLRNSPVTIRENAAMLTGMCLFTGMNYLGQRFFVFKT